LCRLSLILRLLALLFFIGSGKELLAEEESSDFVTVPAHCTIPGDYFVTAENIELLGTVEGDAFLAGMQVYVDGEIKGDLLLAAGNATISGKVHGNVRFFGGQAMLSGEVGKNMTVVAGNFQLIPASLISGNLIAIAGNADLSAPIGGTAVAMASDLRVSSSIGKTLDAAVGHLRLTSKAVIGGDLEYRGDAAAAIDPGAIIHGQFIQYHSMLKKFFHGSILQSLLWGSKFLALFMNFLFTFVVGVVVIRWFPKNLHRAHEVLSTHPIKALGVGVVLLIALPLASLILLMTVLGAPFAIALLAINVLSFYTAKIFSISWASNLLARKLRVKAGSITIFALGLVAYYALTTIPVAGFFVSLAALLFGLGSALLARSRRHLLFEKS
jgi:hypothetical protein